MPPCTELQSLVDLKLLIFHPSILFVYLCLTKKPTLNAAKSD